jgi:hypothetical protein
MRAVQCVAAVFVLFALVACNGSGDVGEAEPLPDNPNPPAADTDTGDLGDSPDDGATDDSPGDPADGEAGGNPADQPDTDPGDNGDADGSTGGGVSPPLDDEEEPPPSDPADPDPSGTTWTRKADTAGMPAGPGGRGWVDTIYDPVAQRTVLFGGSGGRYYNDIWHYDAVGDRWREVEPFIDCDQISGFTPPTQRDEHSVEYDTINHLYWSFGGSGFGCQGPTRTAGAGTATDRIVDPALPAAAQHFYRHWTVAVGTGRAYVSGYDAASSTLTLATPISGLGPGSSYRLYPQRGGGTWYYDPANRSWGSFDGPFWGYTGQTPTNRLSPAFAHSPHHGLMLMHGGQAFNDTWVLDLHSKQWIPMLPHRAAGAPPARAQLTNSMVYDPGNDVFILFGGQCKDRDRCTLDGVLNDTWVYHVDDNRWVEMRPSVRPRARMQHNLVYDPHRRAVVLFGGREGSTYFNDTWIYEYERDTWTRLLPGDAPPGRSIASMSYDQRAGVSVLYGGRGAVGTHRDVWTLSVEE